MSKQQKLERIEELENEMGYYDMAFPYGLDFEQEIHYTDMWEERSRLMKEVGLAN